MRLSKIFGIAGVFAVAFVGCVLAARFSVQAIEEASRHAVRDTLDAEGMVWTQVDTDGLHVYLAGTAPSEAERFRARSIAGGVVESARVSDQMVVEAPTEYAPPSFSIEMLRNERGVSLMGLVPADTDRAALIDRLIRRVRGAEVIDYLNTADYPYPDSWEEALDFAIDALARMERTKISVEADVVRVVSMANSVQAKLELETRLARRLPDDVRLELDVSAPRPVSPPFTLRYSLENGSGRFDACHADSEETRAQILYAAGRAGLSSKPDCTLALGVPSPSWGIAASHAIAAVAELGGGTVTFSDADIAIVALEGTGEGHFDNVIGELESLLPEGFALTAVLPKVEADNSEPVPEIVATLSPTAR